MDFKIINGYLMQIILYCFLTFGGIMVLIYAAAGFTISYTEPEEIEAESECLCVDKQGKLRLMNEVYVS